MELVFERRGAGEPVVLLHGLGSRWQAFEPVLDLLARELEVWAVDLPGFGASPPAARPLSSIGALTDEVQAWMRAKGLEGCHVAGNSTGGGVALELAARGVVASAVALAPIGFWSARERAFCQASLSSTRTLARLLHPVAPALLRVTPLRRCSSPSTRRTRRGSRRRRRSRMPRRSSAGPPSTTCAAPSTATSRRRTRPTGCP